MKYRLTPGSIQYGFNKSRKKIQLFGGGFGNGKSAAACIKALQMAIDYPGSNGLIARETYVKLNDTIRKEFFKWCPPGMVARMPTTTDNTCILKNGSTINFRYISQRGKKTTDGNTTSNLLSATYDWIVVDQIEDPGIQYKDFLDLLGRLRGATPYKGTDPTMPMTGPRFLILTSNPTANWVYTKLVKPYHQWKATGLVTKDLIHDPDTLEPLMDLFEGPTTDNADNLDPDFIQGMKATYKGQMYDRFVLGKWAAYEGLVYPEFSRDMHMIPHQHIMDILKSNWRDRSRFKSIQGFDHGMSVPSSYLCGFVDDIGRIFYVDGFYLPGLVTSQIAKGIKDIQEKYEAYIDFDDPIWADPQIFKKNQVKGQTITTVAKELSDEGLYIKPGQNSIENGIMKVSGYLSIQQFNHYQDPQMPGPNMYFSDRLQHVADEFMGYFWKTNPQGDRIDQPMDRNDHDMDCIKFSLSRAPDPTTLVYRKPPILPEFLQWHEAN